MVRVEPAGSEVISDSSELSPSWNYGRQGPRSKQRAFLEFSRCRLVLALYQGLEFA